MKTTATTENMLLRATRLKLRFPSTRGLLTLEALFDAPLLSDDGFNLNAIAKQINGTLKRTIEENFVEAATTKLEPEQMRAALSLDIVKFVIDTKVSEEKAAATRAKNKLERATLLDALAKKQDATIAGMSEAAIRKRLDALDDADDDE